MQSVQFDRVCDKWALVYCCGLGHWVCLLLSIIQSAPIAKPQLCYGFECFSQAKAICSIRVVSHATTAYPRALVVFRNRPAPFVFFSFPFLPPLPSLFLLLFLFPLPRLSFGHKGSLLVPLCPFTRAYPCTQCKGTLGAPLIWHQLDRLPLSSPLCFSSPPPWTLPSSSSFPLALYFPSFLPSFSFSSPFFPISSPSSGYSFLLFFFVFFYMICIFFMQILLESYKSYDFDQFAI